MYTGQSIAIPDLSCFNKTGENGGLPDIQGDSPYVLAPVFHCINNYSSSDF